MQTYSLRQEHLLNGRQNSNYGLKPEGPTHVWVPVENGEAKHIERVTSTVERGSTLTAHKICYTVKVKRKACCGGMEDKEILKSIE